MPHFREDARGGAVREYDEWNAAGEQKRFLALAIASPLRQTPVMLKEPAQ